MSGVGSLLGRPIELNLQRADGSWANDNGRWWERDPNLVTAYAVIALEMIYRGI